MPAAFFLLTREREISQNHQRENDKCIIKPRAVSPNSKFILARAHEPYFRNCSDRKESLR